VRHTTRCRAPRCVLVRLLFLARVHMECAPQHCQIEACSKLTSSQLEFMILRCAVLRLVSCPFRPQVL
jgi:hypothetical protein